MHWSSSPNAGFSPAGIVTWLPVNANHAAGINVDEQSQDASSLLGFYRRLIEVRRGHAALTRGDCTLLDTGAADALAFVRSVDGRSCLVVLNLGSRDQALELDLPAGELRLLVSSRVRPPAQDARSTLRVGPYEALVAELAPARGARPW
jgi:alpha-glucosidase